MEQVSSKLQQVSDEPSAQEVIEKVPLNLQGIATIRLEKIGFKVIQETEEESNIQKSKHSAGSILTQSKKESECKVVSPKAKRPRESSSLDNAGAVKKAAINNMGMPEQLKRLAVGSLAK